MYPNSHKPMHFVLNPSIRICPPCSMSIHSTCTWRVPFTRPCRRYPGLHKNKRLLHFPLASCSKFTPLGTWACNGDCSHNCVVLCVNSVARRVCGFVHDTGILRASDAAPVPAVGICHICWTLSWKNIVPDLYIQVRQFSVHLLPAFGKTVGSRLTLLLFAALSRRARSDFSILIGFKSSSFSSSTPVDVCLPLSHCVVQPEHSLKIVCMSSPEAPPPSLSEDSVLLTILNCTSSLLLNRTRRWIACTRTSAKNWCHRSADTNLLPLHWPLELGFSHKAARSQNFLTTTPAMTHTSFQQQWTQEPLGLRQQRSAGTHTTQTHPRWLQVLRPQWTLSQSG